MGKKKLMGKKRQFKQVSLAVDTVFFAVTLVMLRVNSSDIYGLVWFSFQALMVLLFFASDWLVLAAEEKQQVKIQ